MSTDKAKTIHTRYFDHRGRRLKAPYTRPSSNPNYAVMRCHANMMLNVYGATYAEVYDVETAECFAQFHLKKSGKLETLWNAESDPRQAGDPIRRTSVHALFHEIMVEDGVPNFTKKV